MFGKKKRKMRAYNVIISAALLFFACSPSSDKSIEGFTFEGPTQGTTYSIIIAEEEIHFQKEEITRLLANFDTILSTYIPNSKISEFNRSEAEYSFSDPNHFFKNCYELSQEVYQASNKMFDPSIYPLVKIWGFYNHSETIPSSAQIDSILPFIGFEKGKNHLVNFRNDSVFFQKFDPRFKLDFNAIAQGYSVDVVADFIEKRGHKNYYLEIGGEVRLKGKNRMGEKWKLGIDVPEQSEERNSITSIQLTDCGLATSGNYRNFFENKGKKYGHILSPINGYPTESDIVSATVIHQNAALADAYATVFMQLGKAKTLAFIKENPEIKVLLIYENEEKELKTYRSKNFL